MTNNCLLTLEHKLNYNHFIKVNAELSNFIKKLFYSL